MKLRFIAPMLAAAVLCTSCIDRVKKTIEVATNYNFGNEELASSANALGCNTAMVIDRADTSSVLYFNPKSKRVFTMTYVNYDGGYQGHGGQYRLDTINAYNPSYGRHGDTAATLVIGDPEAVLELEGIERWGDSLRFRVPIEGEEPFCVRLKLYDKHLEGSDPLADVDVQRMLVLGLTLHYSLEEIEADCQKAAAYDDSVTRTLDSVSTILDLAIIDGGDGLEDAKEALAMAGDSLEHIHGEFHDLISLGSTLGFHHHTVYMRGGKASIVMVGDKCSADQCYERMLRMSEVAGVGYTIQHRPWHRKCRFKAEKTLDRD